MDYMKDIREISDEQAVILWQASRLSLSGKYEKAPEILSVKGSVIGTLGNFSASIGKAKSKKTFNVSAIVAAALKNGTVLRYAAELPEAKRKVLYVDTEQSPHHCLNVMERIMRMAGLPDDRDNENLEFLALRKYTPEQRIRIVEQAIYHTPNLGMVVIDGIRDMVYDINSPSESTRIRDEVMDIFNEFTRDENHAILISSHIVSDLEKLCDTIAFLHKGRLLLCEEKDALREEYALWHGTAAQLAALDTQVYGKRVTPYGVEALVRRDAMPAGDELAPVSIEELFVLMASRMAKTCDLGFCKWRASHPR